MFLLPLVSWFINGNNPKGASEFHWQMWRTGERAYFRSKIGLMSKTKKGLRRLLQILYFENTFSIQKIAQIMGL